MSSTGNLFSRTRCHRAPPTQEVHLPAPFHPPEKGFPKMAQGSTKSLEPVNPLAPSWDLLHPGLFSPYRRKKGPTHNGQIVKQTAGSCTGTGCPEKGEPSSRNKCPDKKVSYHRVAICFHPTVSQPRVESGCHGGQTELSDVIG